MHVQSTIPSGSSGGFFFLRPGGSDRAGAPGGSAREPISLPSRLNPRCCCLSAESDDDCLHHAVHERLGELLRVLKIIISKHQSLNSVDILSTAGTVIATVKGEPQIFPCVNPPPRACRD